MAPSPRAERVSIPGPAGTIEALVERETGASQAFAVVCHPHPLYGGSLDNKVVHTLARTFNELGAPSVRFNFRGVGASEGSFGDGAGESEDTVAVIEWGRRRWPRAALWLGGFSFGGAVALRVAASQRAALLVTVAPAIGRVNVDDVPMPDCRWLIVQGDADDVVSCRDVEEWARQHAAHAQLVVLPGVGHFFHGRLHELKDAVAGFIGRA
jgi:uncharacterized protein